MTGRISVLVSRDLQTLIGAAESLDREVAKQNRAQTRRNVEPMFRDEITHRTGTRLQTRVLVDTSRVSVRDSNVLLKSAHIGKVDRTPADVLKAPTEFGANANRMISVKRNGRTYKRRLGNAFGSPRRAGNTFHPAAYAFIPRAVSLWMQTTYRTVAETFEKVIYMAKGYQVGIASETKAFKQGVESGIIDPLEDAQKELLELGKSRGPDQLEREMEGAQRATDDLKDEIDETRRDLERLGRSGRDAGTDVDKGMGRAALGAQEAGEEIQQSGREAAASFSGDIEDMADFAQETLANALGGFGPAGLAAGIALAAGLGVGLRELEASREQLDEVREVAAEIAQAMYQNPGGTSLDDRVDRLFSKLSQQRRSVNFIERMVENFADLGTNLEAVETAADGADGASRQLLRGLSGNSAEARRGLEFIEERLDSMRSQETWNPFEAWEVTQEIRQVESVRDALKGVVDEAELADDILSAVGSAYDSEKYVEEVRAVGDAWRDNASDAGEYFTESEEGLTSFDFGAYTAGLEDEITQANAYKKALVGLPDEIRSEAGRIFDEQGTTAANNYISGFEASSPEVKRRAVAALSTIGSESGEGFANAAEAAAREKAQGWGPMPVQALPVKVTVDDSAYRNWTPPSKTGYVTMFGRQAI